MEELEEALISWGQTPTKDELQEMMNRADADGSGSIDFGEFVELMKKQMEE